MTRKIPFYFYSASNLLGLAFASLGPLLYLGGVLGNGWGWVTLFAYGFGAVVATLVFPAPRLPASQDLTLDDLAAFLDRLLREHTHSLPVEAVERLRSIHDSLAQVLPKFREVFAAGAVGGREWLTFRQVILSYLPTILGNYLRLPRGYAHLHKVGDTGKTPRQLLVEQLTVLDEELHSAMNTLFESDLNQMLVNSKFLESKFGKATDFLS